MKKNFPLLFIRILGTLICIALLALVRFYETHLFYDPFLLYFKSDFQKLPLPDLNPIKLLISYIFRYSINSIISLGIIYLCLYNRSLIRFSAWMYLILLIVLLALFSLFLFAFREPDNMLLFYVRRLIIQPVFLLLFLAGFLYQNHSKTSKRIN